MYASVSELLNRRSVLRCCALLLCVMVTAPAWPACPKLLMAAGLHIWKQNDSQQAAYWGKTVGVQGFLVNYIVDDWQTDVGTNQDSNKWQGVRQFQSIYSKNGVTDNFIKIALHRAHDWRSPWENEAVVQNLGHAAALAKYAGFKGIAMDLEPYAPTWGGASGGPELSATVEQMGRQIGNAMHHAYPDMTLIILPDVLQANNAIERKRQAGLLTEKQASHGGYGLAIPFVRGLLSVSWKHVVLATEQTYGTPTIAPYVQRSLQRYTALMGDSALWSDVSVAPGLWPLGPSKWDKSPRETPESFKRRLQEAFGVSKQYFWIFGSNSAWQADGPLGPVPGPVAANFQQYVEAIHQVRATCSENEPLAVASPESPPHAVPPRAAAQSAQWVATSAHAAPVQAAHSSQPAGTLPRISVLQATGRPYRPTEIQ